MLGGSPVLVSTSAGSSPGQSTPRSPMGRSLLLLLVAVVVEVVPQSPCSPTPCGINTHCDVNGAGSAVCRCHPGVLAVQKHRIASHTC